MIQWMLAILSLVPLPLRNPAWTSGSSFFRYCWSLAWRILSIILLACEMSAIVRQSEHSLALSFFGTGMKTDLFQSCGHCWVFQICWHIECSTFTASSFGIWNNSAGILSLPLILFVVMLPKAHLTSHSGMSGLGEWLMVIWIIMVIWVMKIFFVWFFCVFLAPLLNIFCFCYVHIISILYWAHLCMKCSLVSLMFIKRSLVFPILLFSSISLHWSLMKAFLSLLAILWNSAFRWVYLSFSPLT